MNKYFFTFFLNFIFLFCFAFGNNDSENVLRIQGQSSENVAPDEIVFKFSVNTENKNLQKMMATLEADLENLKKAVKDAKLPLKKLKSSSYRIYKTYDYSSGKKRFRAYNGSINLSIKIDNNLEKLKQLMMKFYQLENIELNIVFQLSAEKNKIVKSRLIQKAISNARFYATQLTKNSGVKLQEIKEIEYNVVKNSSPYSRGRMEMKAMSSIATSINNASIKVSESVYIVWKIQ